MLVSNIVKILLLMFMGLFTLSLASTNVGLELKWKHQFQFAGYYMAKEKGFYDKAGLDVEILEGYCKSALDDVENARVDFGVSSAGLVRERLMGRPFVALGALFQHSPLIWLVREDSNITKLTDFIGKRIMVHEDNTESVELLSMFRQEGIDRKDIEFINTSYDVNLLINKEVDVLYAYLSNEPYQLKLQGVKYKIFNPRDYGIDFYSDILFTSQEMIQKNPEVVKAFRDASLKGWEYAFEHIDETVEVILKKYNTQNKTKAQLLFEANELKKLTLTPMVNIGHMNKERWKKIVQFYKNLKFLESDVEINLNEFIYETEPQINHTWLIWTSGVLGVLLLIISLFYIQRIRFTSTIAKAKEEYKKFFNLAPLPYQSLDADGNILKVNQAWLDELGFDEDEVVGKNFASFLVAEQAALFRKRFPLFKDSGVSNQAEFTMLSKEGREIIVSFNGKVLYDIAGNFIQTHCIFENMTEKLLLAQELTASEKRYRDFFENNLAVMLEIEPQTGLIVDANNSAVNFYGYTRTQLQEMNIKQINQLSDKEVQRRMDQAKIKERSYFEFVHKLSSGELRDVAVYSGPVKDGNKTYLFSIIFDITQKKKIQDNLEREKRRLKRAEELTHSGWWVQKASGEDVEWSEEIYKILGVDISTFIPTYDSFFSIVHPQDAEGLKKAYQQAVENKSEYSHNYRILRPDGTIRFIQEHACCNFNETDNSCEVFGTLMDITEKIELKEEYKQLFNTVKEGIAIYKVEDNGKQFIIKELNTASLNIEKLKIEDVIGKDVTEVFPGIEEMGLLEVFKEVFSTGKPKQFADKLYKDDRITGWRKHYVYKLPNSDIVTVYEDLTQEYADTEMLKHSAEELDFTQHYFEAVFNAEDDFIFTTIGGEKVDRMNNALLEFLDFKNEEAFSKEHLCVCEYFEKDGGGYLTKETDSQMWLDYMLLHLEIDHRVLMHKKGIEYIFSISAFKINLDRKNRYVVVMSDITSLIHHKQKYQNLLESIGEWVWEVDALGHYTYVNSLVEEILGYSPKEIIGKDFLDFMSDEDEIRDRKEAFAEYSEKKRGCRDMISRQLHKDGYVVTIRSNFQPIIDQSNNLQGFRGTNVDISKEALLQEELKVKDELMLAQSRHAAMGEMIGMIAHQWRQPITSIAMGANNIIVDAALGEIDKDSLNELASDIIDQTQYLSKTIDDFRNFFKPNKEREDINVCSVLDETLSIIGTSLANNNIEVEKELNCQSTISTYSRELLQVYINILKNAKEALLDKKIQDAKIIIRVSEDEKSVVTTICDNAGGIKPELLTKIFEPYFTTKDEKTGTGLGLYMSEIIVNKHLGGSLSVENGSDGACFSILLPKLIGNGLEEE